MGQKKVFFFWTLFLISHLLFIARFPIFEDEAQYLLLAERIAERPWENLFIYLENGLLPAFGWIVAAATVLVHDSLIAGRVVNVLLASSLIFWVKGISELYKMPRAFFWMAMLFLIASPILLLNSRIALLDTPVLVFTAWYIYFTAKLLRRSQTRDFLGLSLSLLGAFFAKATAILGLPTAVLLLTLDAKTRRRGLYPYRKMLIVYFAILLVWVATYIVFRKQINQDTGSSFILHVGTQEILSKIKSNAWLTLHWLNVYYRPFLLVFLSVVFWRFIKKRKLYVTMAFWFFTSLIFMFATNRFYFPRHTLLFVAPLVVIMAGVLSEMPRRIAFLVFLIALSLGVGLSWDILLGSAHAKLALEDRFAYFENYTAGTRVKDIVNYLREMAREQPITVFLDGSYIIEYGLRRELKGDFDINFKSFRLDEHLLPHAPTPVSRDGERATFVLVNRWSPPNISELTEIERFTVSFRHAQKLYAVP